MRVEMKVAPFRALPRISYLDIEIDAVSCRNEGRPFQGIDTVDKF